MTLRTGLVLLVLCTAVSCGRVQLLDDMGTSASRSVADVATAGLSFEGQCCDPLGAGTNGLPACNAFRMVYEYAASAAEIADERSDELPPVCGF
jgi:hypothetical protein